MIAVNYKIELDELTKANTLLLEKKSYINFLIHFVNILVILTISYAMLKLITAQQVVELGQFDYNEIFAVIFGLFWLTTRKAIQQIIVKRNLKNLDKKPISVTINEKEIKHKLENKTLKLKWHSIDKSIMAANGILLLYKHEQFIWLPYRGFVEEKQIKELKASLQKKSFQQIVSEEVVC